MTETPRDTAIDWLRAHQDRILSGMTRQEQAEFALRLKALGVLERQLASPEGVEIQRLSACLRTAYEQTEHFEREYYLAADARDAAQALLTQATAFRIDREITVEKRGDDQWCVAIAGGSVLNGQNEEEYEPNPSSRTDAFIARTRFSLPEAMWRAKLWASLTTAGDDVAKHLSKKVDHQEKET